MKKTLLMAGALLALTAGMASAAGGINLSWTDCGAAGALNNSFACTSNTMNGKIMIASAVSPAVLDEFVGQESEMLIQTNQPALSPWWGLSSQAGFNCRGTTAVAAGFDFTSGPFTCTDPWSGAAAGGMNYIGAFDGPNRAQLRTVCAIPGSTQIDDATEYYLFKITLLGAKTTGTGSCAGSPTAPASSSSPSSSWKWLALLPATTS